MPHVLLEGEAVIFDEVVTQVRDSVTYDRHCGIFCLNIPGTYLIQWDVAFEEHHCPARFEVVSSRRIHGAAASASNIAGQLSSSCLVHVGEAPLDIRLINASGHDVHLSRQCPAANMTITRIANRINQ